LRGRAYRGAPHAPHQARPPLAAACRCMRLRAAQCNIAQNISIKLRSEASSHGALAWRLARKIKAAAHHGA